MHRPNCRRLPALLVLLLGASSGPVAAEVNPALLNSRWTATWIRPVDAPLRDTGVYHFRLVFEVGEVPARFLVHASADNRYQLFVNGRRVLTGPARGDLNHWRFDTADLAPHLQTGPNVLAAVVWNYADHAPMAQVSHQTAFIVQGDTEREHVVNTGPRWKARRDTSRTLLPVDRASIHYEYFVAGPGEQLDAAAHPWGWERPGYDDGAWGGVVNVSVGAPRAIRDTPSRWMLVPRGIPLMEERPERFARVARAEGAVPPDGWLTGQRGWTIPPRAAVRVLLDRGHLTTAYPELRTSGGRGASLSLVYAEALREQLADGKKGPKGHRDEVAGKVATGLRDRFLPDGSASRTFRPLWWRTYRYVELEVATADDPLTIDDVAATFTAYPLERRAAFDSSDPELARIWEVGWRTARVCAHETYMDTPYWEQLQYVGDTRIQALLSMYVGGDDRLVRNAIQLFEESRLPDGLTQSRYPTELPQIIPPFSLFWIGMLHDFYMFTGDAAFVAPYLRGAANVLDWFDRRRSSSGLLGRLEWWNFADWVDGHGFDFGEPPFDQDGQSAILSLQFVLALREAADLEEAFGSAARAAAYRAIADEVATAVMRLTWDPGRELFADTPSRRHFSQHANVLALLAGIVPPSGRQALMERVLSDPSLAQTTYYFRFYLFRALRQAGMADRYLALLEPWKQMLALGLTTWAERPEPTRSDSHAWSAHPNYDLLTTVAGIEPATPGFGRVRIAPHLGDLTGLHASVPAPPGVVSVAYTRTGEQLTAEITLPVGVTGEFHWNGRTVPLRAGRQTLQMP